MAFHIAAALLTYAFFPKLTNKIPASLAAIIATTILEHTLVRWCGFSTNTVFDLASVKGSFPVPVWFNAEYRELMPPLNGETFAAILPVSFTAAAIGLLESLLTLEIIDGKVYNLGFYIHKYISFSLYKMYFLDENELIYFIHFLSLRPPIEYVYY